MLEVVFNDSVRNSMKLAKNYKKENMLGGTVAYLGTAPHEACGFYFVNTILNSYDCNISSIKIPRFKVQSDNSVAVYSSWNEIMPGKFYNFIPLETKVDKELRNTIAIEWR